MVKTKSLTKSCTSCGQQKPLSAFLQIAGSQGTTYGNICSTCRKTEHENPKQPREIDEGTKSDSGLKIDSKAKVHSDIKNREQVKQTEELYFEEREKDEATQDLRTENIQHVAKEEQKHRDTILGKRSFLDNSKAVRSAPGQQIFGGETQKAKAAEIGLDATSDLAMGKKTKHQTDAIKRYLTWIGDTSPLARAMKQNQISAKNKSKTVESKDEKTAVLSNYVKNTWRK